VLYFSFNLLANMLAEPFEKSCQTVASARKRIIIPPLSSSSIRDVVGMGGYVPYMCARCHMLRRQTSRTANFEKEVNKEMRKSEGKGSCELRQVIKSFTLFSLSSSRSNAFRGRGSCSSWRLNHFPPSHAK